MSYRACQGEVYTGADGATPSTLVGFISGYSHTETAEEIDVSVMGDCTKSYLPGPVEGEITLDMFSRHLPSTDADSTQDSGQATLRAGAVVSLAIQPAGTGTGKPRIEWTSVSITGSEFAGLVDGAPTYNITARASVAADEIAQT